jgi:hypothetical protein
VSLSSSCARADQTELFPVLTFSYPYLPPIYKTKKIVDIIHPNLANVSKNDIRERLSKTYKTPIEAVSVFGFRNAFGGGRVSLFFFDVF